MIQNIEKTILNSYFFDYTLLEKTTLKAKDFYLPNHQKIFNAMQELLKEDLPLDTDFLVKKLGNNFENSILDILQATATANVVAYEKEIIEESRKREITTQLNLLRARTDLSSTELAKEIEKTFTGNTELNNSFNFVNLISSKNIKSKKPSFLLKDYIPLQEREINLFSASGGGGKSWTLLKLLAKLNVMENKRVFGWFSEDEVEITKDRLEILQNADTSIKNAEITFTNTRAIHFVEYDKNRNLKESEAFYKFKKQMKDFDVICLDPLIAFFGGEENDNVQARFFTDLLNDFCKKENKTLLIIHHHSKGENGTARGAGAFIDAVRIHYTVNKIENNTANRRLKLEKTNHFYGKNTFDIQLFKNNFEVEEQVETIKEEIKKPSLWEEIS